MIVRLLLKLGPQRFLPAHSNVVVFEGRTVYTDYNVQGLKTAVGSLGTTTTYEYDYKDRLTTVTNALGHKTVYAYNAINQVTSVTDPLGNATTYDYSPTTGTLTSVTDAEGGVISYEYDLFGHMTKLIDQRGKETVYEYDAFGRLISETNPLSQTTEYEYDDHAGCGSCGTSGGSGHVSSITDPAGRTTFYEYGPGDRLTTVTYSASSDMVVHSYDDFGRRISTFDNRLPMADFPTQTFAWEYDNFDRMTKEIYPDGEEVAWEYDLHGRRTKMTDPDGNHTQYVYANAANNKKLASIGTPFGSATTFEYNAKGLLDTQVDDSGYISWYSYDSQNRIGTILHMDADPWNNIGMTYTYNAASQISEINYNHRLTPGGHVWENRLRKYTYDDVYRLKSEERLVGPNTLFRHSYDYDLAGNRTAHHRFDGTTTKTSTLTYNDFNQLTSAVSGAGLGALTKDYTYDLAGNRIEKKTSTFAVTNWNYYSHNRENRFSQASRQSNQVPLTIDADYVYDFSGRLLMRVSAVTGEKRKYYYDGINTLLTREKPAGTGTCFRTASVFGLKDASIGAILNEKRATYATDNCSQPATYEYINYHYDHIGNVVATSLMDGWGTLREWYDMEAFGNVEQGNQYDGPRLTSKLADPATGFYYFGARWYDRETGRWLQKEPLGLDGPNWYNFNFSNPSMRLDINGLMSRLFWGKHPEPPPSRSAPKKPAPVVSFSDFFLSAPTKCQEEACHITAGVGGDSFAFCTQLFNCITTEMPGGTIVDPWCKRTCQEHLNNVGMGGHNAIRNQCRDLGIVK